MGQLTLWSKQTGKHGSEDERERTEEGAGTSTDPIRGALLNVIVFLHYKK